MGAPSVNTRPRLAVIGLGYVGLPLAIALARHFEVIGFDIKAERVAALRGGHDQTGEVDAADLASSSLQLTSDVTRLGGHDVYIVTVPTPVDPAHRPDLAAVRAACRTVGRAMGRGAIVVLESTVYPGVTEDVCGPELAAASGLIAGRDFFLGYSPERINPGDKEHTVERITKVVSGQTSDVAERLAGIYGRITTGGVFVAKSIKVAEAAKVIENAQRDINIAFINEVTTIFNRLGLSVYDVLAAARTKWNFLPFTPGLVGGHCIGVDPYYLADLSQRIGHDPQVILAGRRINDGMSQYISGSIAQVLADRGFRSGSRILILGLTFKENVPDLRNSKIIDIVTQLKSRGYRVDVHDPLADPDEAEAELRVKLLPTLADVSPYDAVIGAVPHRVFAAFGADDLMRLIAPNGIVADVKGMWAKLSLPATVHRWSL